MMSWWAGAVLVPPYVATGALLVAPPQREQQQCESQSDEPEARDHPIADGHDEQGDQQPQPTRLVGPDIEHRVSSVTNRRIGERPVRQTYPPLSDVSDGLEVRRTGESGTHRQRPARRGQTFLRFLVC